MRTAAEFAIVNVTITGCVPVDLWTGQAKGGQEDEARCIK
jgi:hypothetical protein